MTEPTLKEAIIADLEESAREVERVCREILPELQRRKPGPDKWSVLDILCHLSDTERLIFRHRFRMFLLDETQEPYFPDIDHTPWEDLHRYADRDPEAALADFLLERKETVALVASYSEAQLKLQGQHEVRGTITLSDVASYCAKHTRIHVDQIKRTALAIA